MPRKGYKGITVDEKTYGSLAEVARRLKKTIPETIKFLLNEAKLTVAAHGQDPSQRTQVNSTILDEDEEWTFPDKCEPLETCVRCPFKYLCWKRKLLRGDKETLRKFFLDNEDVMKMVAEGLKRELRKRGFMIT